MNKLLSLLAAIILTGLLIAPAFAKDLSVLDQWKPKFDPSGAKYTYILSNVDHPAIAGIGVGYRIRDRLWEASNGQIYVDFRPLAQLGGEKDVLSKLKMGAIQGMLCSSVAAANLAPKLGIVNLPFVIDTPAKLETFRTDPELFQPFSEAALGQGVRAIDFTGYGSYGWATTTPVRSLVDAKGVNFRIAQAPVNTDVYKAWALKFTVMPWPDVPQALQTGVINGLDHTPIVCSVTKKFEVAKYFTRLDYTQGLYIHLINERWLKQLPADLQATFLQVVSEESTIARKQTFAQQDEQIAAAQAGGIEFFSLPAEDIASLQQLAAPVYEKWGEKIGTDYLTLVRSRLGN